MSTPRPLGGLVPDAQCSFPPYESSSGSHVRLIPTKAEHADELFAAMGGKEDPWLYDYLPYGPFDDLEGFRKHIATFAGDTDPQMYSIQLIATGELVGYISFLHIDSKNRVIEIGHLCYSPVLQRTASSTEAWYLLASKAFDLGYRRLEWRCNALNQPSRKAALRFGHAFDGVFHQHSIVKGRNRDSAIYSILDKDWPTRKQALLKWMDPGNFEKDGSQRKSLASLQERAGAEAI